MSRHEPFEQAEARRPAFQADKFSYSKQANPSWQPGDGLNGRTDLPSYEAFVHGATPRGSIEDFKHIDPDTYFFEDRPQIYKLMIGGIVPRPIALCSTVSPQGRRNLAPFSFSAPIGFRPPMVMVHFSCREPLTPGKPEFKDSIVNIKATKQFVVNIISEPFAEAANYAAINSPDDVSEWDLTGLTPIESEVVSPPRVGESAYAMECTLEFFNDIHDDEGTHTSTMVAGRIRRFHVRKDLFGPTGAIDPGKLLPIARLGGISYARVTDAYESPRPVWDEAVAKRLNS